jgi:hypothetical protein
MAGFCEESGLEFMDCRRMYTISVCGQWKTEGSCFDCKWEKEIIHLFKNVYSLLECDDGLWLTDTTSFLGFLYFLFKNTMFRKPTLLPSSGKEEDIFNIFLFYNSHITITVYRVMEKSLCIWWLQHKVKSYFQNVSRQSDCLAADRQGQGH